MAKIKKLLQKPEAFCLIITIILFLFIQILSGQFFTVNNLTDLLAASFPELWLWVVWWSSSLAVWMSPSLH